MQIVGDARLPTEVTKFFETKVFDETTVPRGLLADHTTKAGSWGLLVVRAGVLDYVVPGTGTELPVAAGQAVVIEPELPHHVSLRGPVRFQVQFYRRDSGP